MGLFGPSVGKRHKRDGGLKEKMFCQVSERNILSHIRRGVR